MDNIFTKTNIPGVNIPMNNQRFINAPGQQSDQPRYLPPFF